MARMVMRVGISVPGTPEERLSVGWTAILAAQARLNRLKSRLLTGSSLALYAMPLTCQSSPSSPFVTLEKK